MLVKQVGLNSEIKIELKFGVEISTEGTSKRGSKGDRLPGSCDGMNEYHR